MTEAERAKRVLQALEAFVVNARSGSPCRVKFYSEDPKARLQGVEIIFDGRGIVVEGWVWMP